MNRAKEVYKFSEIFDTMFYPAGEPHIKLKENLVFLSWARSFIVADCRDWNDLMAVVIGHEVLRDNGIDATFVIPYFPFSRHDRRNDARDSSPVPFVLQMLKDIHAVTIDPHSDVSGVLPHYAQSEVVKLFAEKGIFDDHALVAIPDAGASKKSYSWIDGDDVVQCLKIRDTKTGKLSGFQVINSELVEGRNVVIIDDICDGGGTFLGLASELKKAGASSLRLGVTHGLFTQGLNSLWEWYERIYTLDTCHIDLDRKLKTVSVEQLIMEGRYF